MPTGTAATTSFVFGSIAASEFGGTATIPADVRSRVTARTATATAAASKSAPPTPSSVKRRPVDRPQRRRPRARSRARRRNALRRRQRRIVGEHRLLEALQSLARLEAQLLGEQAARLVVDTQRVGLSAGAIEREHQLPAKALAQWMLRNESLQLRSDVGVAAESQIGLEPLLHCAEPQLVQPADLALSERVVGEVGEGRPAPEGERLRERRRPRRSALPAASARRPSSTRRPNRSTSSSSGPTSRT